MSGSLRRWIYVSKPMLSRESEASTISQIVELARSRNSILGVTGALVFTGDRFAQLLEGSTSKVAELRESIYLDQRHTSVTTVSDEVVKAPLFADWSLAYSGPARYLARVVDGVGLGAPVVEATAGANLLQMFREFSYEATTR